MSVFLHDFIKGEPNWVDPLNNNFKALNQDTGWVALTLIAPATFGSAATTKPQICCINGRVQMLGNLSVSLTSVPDVANGVRIATFPTEFAPTQGWVYGKIPITPLGGTVSFHVSGSGLYLHETVSLSNVDLGQITYLQA
ncbi:hypothetical protein [Lactiplantibacillus mudanjiangensis]|uniref:Uncharacterized protein n=1 Tax=Lactiplantibacillus mudanjiangensis TaxID=1296538 RepID=A0A660DWQ6_9LACO|nr:hypothetical protein [Lactiplantibacillus mudanjiangensis]VDG23652.1 hypothetical protein MUDAN_IGPPGNFN_02189 [Lactiplantibacillus mudanjiangensis]VDG27795.1 hypothetical protein MUDAN_MDHGFNIF_02618 [Lactiplantibacillus mudanjiangensis]